MFLSPTIAQINEVDYRFSVFAPLESVLCRRSRIHTPQSGLRGFINRFLKQHPEYAKLLALTPVYGEPITEPYIEIEDVLYANF